MKHKELKELKVGDWIYHITKGWRRITYVCESSDYPINTGLCDYDLDGFLHENDINPTIYTYNPFDPDDQPPVEFKKGEVIMVRDVSEENWTLVKLFSTKGGMLMDTYGNTWKHARKLTDEEKGI